MFFAPCTLPLAPIYLGYLGGISFRDIQDPVKYLLIRKKIFIYSIFFIIGFSVVFISLGGLAGFVGNLLVPYKTYFTRAGGVMIIVFGLSMLGIFKLPAFIRGKKVRASNRFFKNKIFGSFIFGASFALGWSPCIGPILGTILFLASQSATALQGAFLLFIFSLGLALPFLILSLSLGSAFIAIKHITKYLRIIEVIAGTMLIGIGVLFLFGKFTLIVSWGYKTFEFINYDRLLDFL